LGKTYKGGELRTIQTYRYGRIEARIKAAVGDGIVNSLFTYNDYISGGAENWNEIDIEFLGNQPNVVQFNTITANQVHHVYVQSLAFQPADEFHTYAFEWTPTYVAWFVDGVEVHRQTGAHINSLDKYQKIMMNIWPPNYPDWVGILDPANLSVYAYYDWIRYCAYVPGTGNTGTDNNFIELWYDNFDYWELTRWEKATHTFYGNLCDFVPANVEFVDGFMVLCLTTADSLGYNGNPLANNHTQNVASEFSLHQAYPNPFNSTVSIPIELTKVSVVNITIYDIMGRHVQTVVNENIHPGKHTFYWEANTCTSGLYFIETDVNNNRLYEKVMLVK